MSQHRFHHPCFFVCPVPLLWPTNLVPLRRLVDPPLQLGEQHRHLLRPHRHHDLRSVAIERAEGGGLPILPFCTVMAERLILGSTYRSYPTYTFTMGE